MWYRGCAYAIAFALIGISPVAANDDDECYTEECDGIEARTPEDLAQHQETCAHCRAELDREDERKREEHRIRWGR